GDRGEEQPVEARVAALAGPFADLAGGEGGSVRHVGRLAPALGRNWPFSDMDAVAWMGPGLRPVERSLLHCRLTTVSGAMTQPSKVGSTGSADCGAAGHARLYGLDDVAAAGSRAGSRVSASPSWSAGSTPSRRASNG